MQVGNRTKNLSNYYGEFIKDHWSQRENPETARVLLLEKAAEKPRNIIVTSATPGVELDAKLCKGYISRIINGELDSILFKNYGKQGFKLRIEMIAPHRDNPTRIKYFVQANKSMTMGKVAYMVGIHHTQLIFKQNRKL